MNSDVKEEAIQFSREDVATQVAARASLRRGLITITAILVGCLAIAFFAFPRLGLSNNLLSLSVIAAPVLALLAIRQLQWSVLASHQLRCPSCRHLLVTERRWWNSPNAYCRSCGKLALLPVAALKRAAAT
ncbi:hypothetical protein AB4Y64_17580 [Lysobacter sp. TAF61]|uniref:hypothetical protein n=1 Tax=Lysobacter sp. TAF61 TaxID=3233072 RepID=UPI003F9948A7